MEKLQKNRQTDKTGYQSFTHVLTHGFMVQDALIVHLDSYRE
jgi:hypothetical protein